MTTPVSDPLIIPVTNQVSQLCPALGPGSSVLILNTDSQANLFIGRSYGMTSANAMELPPGASSIEDASKAILGFTDATSPPILAQVGPGTSQYNLGPQQVLNDISITALATAIAEALDGTDFTPVASPVLLYDIGPSGPTIAGQWGATVYGAKGQSFSSAFAQFQNVTSTTITSFKIYNLPIPTLPGDIAGNVFLQYCIAHPSVRACLCFNPALDGSDASHLNTSYGNLIAAGITNASVVFWQEWQDHGITPAQIQAVYGAYYSGVSIHYPGGCVYDSAGSHGVSSWTAGDPSPFCDVYAIDLYAHSYYADPANDPIGIVNLAHSHSKPWAIYEMGASVGNQTPPPISGPDSTQQYIEYVTTLVTTDLDAGLPVDSVMWYYQPQENLNNDPTPFITQIDALAAALTVGGTAPFTINAGASKILEPLNPSPVAGYATADALSYDIVLNFVAGAGSGNPFARVRLYWYNDDDPNARPVDIQQWALPMGVSTGSGTQIWGRGPQRGQFLKIQVFNSDSVTLTMQMQLNATARANTKDDWRWDVSGSVNIPTYTRAPDGGAYFNELAGIQAELVPAGGQLNYLISLHAGKAWCRFGTAANNPVIIVSMSPQPGSIFNGGQLLNELISGTTGTTVPGDFVTELILPRAPCMITFTNIDGATAHLVYAQVIALD